MELAETIEKRLPRTSTEAIERCHGALEGLQWLNTTDWSQTEFECLFGTANDLVEESFKQTKRHNIFLFSNLVALCCTDPRIAKPHYSQTCSLLLPNSRVWEAKGYYFDFVLNCLAGRVFERQHELGERLIQGRMKVGAQTCDLRHLALADLGDLGAGMEFLQQVFIKEGLKRVEDPEWYVVLIPAILRLLDSFEASQRS